MSLYNRRLDGIEWPRKDERWYANVPGYLYWNWGVFCSMKLGGSRLRYYPLGVLGILVTTTVTVKAFGHPPKSLEKQVDRL